MEIYEDDLDDGVFGVGIREIERRADLERIRAQGARVEVELTEDTPFRRYVEFRRSEATAALARLSVTDATDAIAVLREQHIIAEYLRVREWSRVQIEASIEADHSLQEDHRDQAE